MGKGILDFRSIEILAMVFVLRTCISIPTGSVEFVVRRMRGLGCLLRSIFIGIKFNGWQPENSGLPVSSVSAFA